MALKGILLNESQTQKATYSMILFTLYPGRGKTAQQRAELGLRQ